MKKPDIEINLDARPPKRPQNPIIAQLADIAARNIPTLFAEREGDILAALAEMDDAASDSEKPPKHKFTVSVTHDTGTNAVVVELGWTVKYRESIAERLEDPNQGKLPLAEE